MDREKRNWIRDPKPTQHLHAPDLHERRHGAAAESESPRRLRERHSHDPSGGSKAKDEPICTERHSNPIGYLGLEVHNKCEHHLNQLNR